MVFFLSSDVCLVLQPSLPIRRCILRGVCTLAATGTRFAGQLFYQCFTCGLQDGRGCCASCLRRCHAGHQVDRGRWADSFYCDCGVEGERCRCVDMTFDAEEEQEGE